MSPVLTREQALEHWQGHRRLTRRTIEAFPSDEAFTTFSVGGMRPFAELTKELLHVAVPSLQGIVTREWPWLPEEAPATKAEALERWDVATAEINRLFPQIPDGRFDEVDRVFGQWEMPVWAALFYAIDNEVHHRAQGFVYLRALGVEPPAFPDRS
ncbi:MAG: damage-inducible protein DinB [Rhodothermales bacterium]|nr:damage-inducible protein DinB [Rhodothermales bacterium]